MSRSSLLRSTLETITCSSCLLMLIQGKTLARAVVFPHPPGVGCSSFPHGPRSQGRGWSCLGLPTESDQYWCWQGTHPRGNPAAWCWDRDHTAKAEQHVKRRKACVVNMAEKRYGVKREGLTLKTSVKKHSVWNLARMQGFLTAKTATGSLLSIWVEMLLVWLAYISKELGSSGIKFSPAEYKAASYTSLCNLPFCAFGLQYLDFFLIAK